MPYIGPGANGPGNIPAFVFIPFLVATLPEIVVMFPETYREYVVLNKLIARYDGFRASLGMTVTQVDELYGAPLKTVPLQNGRSARLYGDRRKFGYINDFSNSQLVAVVFDSQGRVSVIYSNAFFNPDWLN